MFCRKCGNQLADNAKFCNACGNPVAVNNNADPQPVIPDEPAAPVMEEAIIPGSVPIPEQTEQPAYQQPNPQPYQPYQPNYQQPAAQPYPYPQTSPVPTAATSQPGKIDRFLVPILNLFFFSIMLICTTLLPLYGDKAYSFGPASYLKDLSKVTTKNIFSVSIDAISDGNNATRFMYLGIWVHIIFCAVAFIFLLIAFIRLFTSSPNKEYKVICELRISILSSFIGILFGIGFMIASYMSGRNAKFSGVFSNVLYFWSYIVLAVAIGTVIAAFIIRGKAKKQHEYDTAYSNPNAMYPQSSNRGF